MPHFLSSLTNDRADSVPGVALHGLRHGVVEQGREAGNAEAVPEPEVQKDGDIPTPEEYAAVYLNRRLLEAVARRMGESSDGA